MEEGKKTTRITLDDAKRVGGKSNLAKLIAEQRKELASPKKHEASNRNR